MFAPHSRSIKQLEARSKRAFSFFTAATLTDAAVEVARPGSRNRLAAALKNASTRPDAAYEKAAAALRAEVEGISRDWEAVEDDAHRWKSVAAALRGEDADIEDPALAAAVEAIKQSPQAASLAREIDAAVAPVLDAVSASKVKHVAATRNAMRHAVHRAGMKVYGELGEKRKALTHELMFGRAAREAANRRAAIEFVRAGGTTRG